METSPHSCFQALQGTACLHPAPDQHPAFPCLRSKVGHGLRKAAKETHLLSLLLLVLSSTVSKARSERSH